MKNGSTKAPATPITDPVKSAKAAGLRYVSDTLPGIRREPAEQGYRYIGIDGKVISDPEELQRIESLAIPPAWTEVWICPLPHGHLQATGRDARGRKQYRYHPQWSEIRGQTKYDRMLLFGEALPLIREQVERDLALRGLPRRKVLATIVRLLETTFIRVGNKEYARANRSFGLTTLRDRHVKISGSSIQFQFRGKSGQTHSIDLKDRRLARIVKQCRDIPGYELFQYIDENGQRQTVDSGDVNAYLREITGQDFTAKDFRTWGGTVLAALTLNEMGAWESESGAKKNVVQAIKEVAHCLGNRPATCRKYYVHPAVLETYLDGNLLDRLQQELEAAAESPNGLKVEETAMMALLRQYLAEKKS
ncbi:MAG: DNA topoisomerase IB [Anaerolineae bacterium]|nr:DNA topoisomerase IB [Anaerolineae bacterium]